MLKKILLVVAHPDDEILWFLGGIKFFTKQYQVDILCLTYNSESARGKELLEATKTLAITVFFGDLNDPGFDLPLLGVTDVINKLLRPCLHFKTYDLVITHPFHGGEKPHPHHIQAFYSTKYLCRKHRITFGFFSERAYPSPDSLKGSLLLNWPLQSRSAGNFLKTLISSFFRSPANYNLRMSCFFETITDLLFGHRRFFCLSIPVCPIEKEQYLQAYESQTIHLEKYQFRLANQEYLYIETSPSKQKPAFKDPLQHLMEMNLLNQKHRRPPIAIRNGEAPVRTTLSPERSQKESTELGPR